MIKLLIALCLACLSELPAPQKAPAAESSAAAAILREEFFVLEALPADLDPLVPHDLERTHAEALVLGLVACRTRHGGRGRTLEWELRFPDEDVRVLHVEHERGAGPSLVWREWQSNRGRTITVEPTADGGAHILEWGGSRPVRRELAAGARLPLGLLDELRNGVLEEGGYRVFNPLTYQLDELRVQLREPTPTRRIAELLRPDGSSAAIYVFEGTDLVAFQWQAGHMRARRIDATDYLHRLAEAAR